MFEPSFLPSSLNPARTPSAPNPPLSCVVVVGDDEAQQPQRQSAQIREMERRAREMLWTTETHAVWEWARKQSTRIILNVTHRQFWKGFFRATEFLIFCFFLLFFFNEKATTKEIKFFRFYRMLLQVWLFWFHHEGSKTNIEDVILKCPYECSNHHLWPWKKLSNIPWK